MKNLKPHTVIARCICAHTNRLRSDWQFCCCYFLLLTYWIRQKTPLIFDIHFNKYISNEVARSNWFLFYCLSLFLSCIARLFRFTFRNKKLLSINQYVTFGFWFLQCFDDTWIRFDKRKNSSHLLKLIKPIDLADNKSVDYAHFYW